MKRGWIFFLAFLLLIGNVHGHNETFCRDSSGRVVDWWILYKESGTRRYIYLSSLDAAAGKSVSEALRGDRLVDDPKTSPFLRTVYDSKPLTDGDDNRMIMAWNDQQPTKSGEEHSKKAAKAVRVLQNMDPNYGELKIGEGKDMYGRGESEEYAHSKGLLGLSVKVPEKDGVVRKNGRGEARFYLIQHSFPKAPNGSWDQNGTIKRRFIAEDPADFFGKNIRTPLSKAQHAVCISMTQKVTIKDGEIVYNRKELDRKEMNLFALLDGLDVIGPSLTLTNYVPWLSKFRIYHQLFDIRSKWRSNPITSDEFIKNSNVARIMPRDMLSLIPNGEESSHAYPLWPSGMRVTIKDGGVSKWHASKGELSLRMSPQLAATRCRMWSAENGGRRDDCFVSARFTSTSKQSQIIFNADFKNGRVIADTDDIIAARLISKQDSLLANSLDWQAPKKYVALVVVTQSWFDHATLGSHSREIVDTAALKVKIWFHNSLGVRLPVNGEKQPVIQGSNGKDHSKWFVSYLYGQTGSYIPVAGVMDLNRNGKHTRLPNREYGRSGMILTSTLTPFVKFFMDRGAVIEDNSNFSNVPIDLFSQHHVPEDKVVLASVNSFNSDGSGMMMRFTGLGEEIAVRAPYRELPPVPKDEALVSTPVKLMLAEHRQFQLGSPGFKFRKFSPKNMYNNPRPGCLKRSDSDFFQTFLGRLPAAGRRGGKVIRDLRGDFDDSVSSTSSSTSTDSGGTSASLDSDEEDFVIVSKRIDVGQKVTVSDQKVTVSDQKVTVSDQKVTVSDQKVTVSGQNDASTEKKDKKEKVIPRALLEPSPNQDGEEKKKSEESKSKKSKSKSKKSKGKGKSAVSDEKKALPGILPASDKGLGFGPRTLVRFAKGAGDSAVPGQKKLSTKKREQIRDKSKSKPKRLEAAPQILLKSSPAKDDKSAVSSKERPRSKDASLTISGSSKDKRIRGSA